MAMADNEQTTFNAALSIWRDIALSSLQKTLDEQGLEIIDAQKESVASRKEIATKTKEFRKLPDDEKLLEVKGLLKLYQTEIDSLTKRAKNAESHFLSLYKVVGEAPDPYPLLEATLDQAVNSAELDKLKEENASLKAKLTSQEDIDDLKAKLAKAESQIETTAKEREDAKEQELKALIQEKERNWAEKETSLTAQAQESREQVKELKAEKEVAQARAAVHDAKFDEGVAGRLAELDIVIGDLERANLRVTEVSKRNEELASEVAALKSGRGTASEERAQQLDARVRELEEDLEKVSKTLQKAKEDRVMTEGDSKKKIAVLEKDLERKGEEAESLRKKLREFDDYDEIKRELEMFKAVEFNTGDSDDDEEEEEAKPYNVNTEGSAGAAADSGSGNQSSSLEKALHARNKKLTSELTILRVSQTDLQSQLTSLETELARLTHDLDEKRALNAKLENDLLQVNNNDAGAKTLGGGYGGHGGGGSVAGRTTAGWTVSGWTTAGRTERAGLGGGRVSPTSSIIGLRDDTPLSSLKIPGSDGAVGNAGAGILPIVTQQRDRFRARAAQLEEDLRKQNTTIAQLRSEVEGLQKDNVQLYEKTRYLSQYRETGTSGGVRRTRAEELALDDLEGGNKYGKAYEQSVNPFEAFRGKESARALSSLNGFDKIVYSMSRTVLANKVTRNLFVGYSVFLHFLVMMCLYRLTLIDTETATGAAGAWMVQDENGAM
ncbi:hypothetical protein YB2330_002223 [Saitoella coloradoensis]